MTYRTASVAAVGCALLGALVAPHAAVAADLPDIQFTPELNLRLREEFADQSDKMDNAYATTLRHRLGLAFTLTPSLTGLVESEGTVSLFEQNYNSKVNGRSNFPVVADPTGDELNQAFLNWKASDSFSLKVGRQRIIYDNARFIGNVGWRQNEQTFDGVSAKWSASPAVSVHYAYVQKVNTILFTEAKMGSHFLNGQFKPNDQLSLTGYAYLLDFDTGLDTQTLGLRATGTLPTEALKLSYTVEYAQQKDYAESSNIDNDYLSMQLIAGFGGGFSAGLGLESLGGDGNVGFATPLATAHAFNGWADLFIKTPDSGLIDTYLQVGYKAGAWKVLSRYHQFEADTGSSDFGNEIDLLVAYKINRKATVLAKFADFASDSALPDTTRFVTQLDLSL